MRSTLGPRLLAFARPVLAACAIGAALTATPAIAHDYYYWYSGPQTKVNTNSVPAHPSTCPKASAPTQSALTFSAAQGEFEGRQIAIRPFKGAIKDIWFEPSDLVTGDGSATIQADNVSAYKIGFVQITKASYGLHATGGMPDPLIPMQLANGEKLGWHASAGSVLRGTANNRTQPFYVLFGVPSTAQPGLYRGTITVTAKGTDGTDLATVQVPVALTVYPFSIAKKTLRTTFGVNLHWAMYANSHDHMWGNKPKEMGGWLKYMSDHRLSPETLYPAWSMTNNMTANTERLTDYLGTGSATTFSGERFGFNTVRMPEYLNYSYLSNPFSSSSNNSKARTYFKSMHASLGSYSSRAVVYPCDEPVASKRTFVEKYAAFAHKYAPGSKFLLTTDPITMKYKPLKGVDIYVQKLHFFYRDYSKWVAPLRRSGKSVWVYSHAGSFQTQTPNYLVDAPLPAARANGWFAYHTNSGGLLYFDVAAWRPNKNSPKYRDPYKDPLSYRCPPYYANGDGSLVYPGYYPKLGLVVEGAPPVGSLRMEALRDGLEDYEYMKLHDAKYGRASTLGYLGKVIGKPTGVKSSGKPTFPSFAKTPAPYDSVRATLAARIAK